MLRHVGHSEESGVYPRSHWSAVDRRDVNRLISVKRAVAAMRQEMQRLGLQPGGLGFYP